MLRDLRPILRSFARQPGFLAVTVLPLACGLGAAVAVFSLAYGLLLGPVGLPDTDKVLSISQNLPELGGSEPMSAASLLAITERQTVFQSVASLQVTDRTLTERGDPVRIKVASVTPSFFALSATKPALGRYLQAGDVLLSAAKLPASGDGSRAVLSDSLWRSRFGGARSVIGQSIVLEGRRYEIVGVMPPDLHYPVEAQVWLPLGFRSLAAQDFGSFYFQMIARLKPGVGLEQTRKELAHIADTVAPTAPSFMHGLTFETATIRESLVGDQRTPVLLLLGLTLVIVFGVSANAAQILLARVLVKQRDLALRQVLGASRGQVIRLVVAEGLILASLGWGLGILWAGLALKIFGHAVPLRAFRGTPFSLNGPALAFSLGIALASGLVLGFIPALILRQANLLTYLKEGTTRSSAGLRQRYLQKLLLAAQLALALILVASGSLLLASFVRLQTVRLGFDPKNVTTVDLTLPEESYDPGRIRIFISQAVEALHALPGTSAVAVSLRLPVLDESGGVWFYLPEKRGMSKETAIAATFNAVSPGFSSARGMPVLAGRDLSDYDREGSEPVAIVDEILAQQFFGSESPLDRSIVLTPWPNVHRRIVGVVPAVRYGGLREKSTPTIYVPASQMPLGRLRLLVRSSAPSVVVLPAVRQSIWRIDPRLAFDSTGTFEARLADFSSPDRWALRLVLVLGILGLVLSGSCIYGATTQLVSQSFRELGIRLALGCLPKGIVRHVISERLPDLVAGLALGLVGVWVISHWARAVLFEVSPLDPFLLAISTAVLGGSALLAIYLPARRAGRIDPATVLR